jgi:hypothetical protein
MFHYYSLLMLCYQSSDYGLRTTDYGPRVSVGSFGSVIVITPVRQYAAALRYSTGNTTPTSIYCSSLL